MCVSDDFDQKERLHLWTLRDLKICVVYHLSSIWNNSPVFPCWHFGVRFVYELRKSHGARTAQKYFRLKQKSSLTQKEGKKNKSSLKRASIEIIKTAGTCSPKNAGSGSPGSAELLEEPLNAYLARGDSGKGLVLARSAFYWPLKSLNCLGPNIGETDGSQAVSGWKWPLQTLLSRKVTGSNLGTGKDFSVCKTSWRVLQFLQPMKYFQNFRNRFCSFPCKCNRIYLIPVLPHPSKISLHLA